MARVTGSITSNIDITSKSFTNFGVLTFPTVTDTIVAQQASATLENKTIDNANNNVSANRLRSSGTPWSPASISLEGSSPTVDQVLTFNGTNAIWAPVPNPVPIVISPLTTTDATPVAIQTISTTANTSYLVQTSIIARATTEGTSSSFVYKALFNRGASVVQIVPTDELKFGTLGSVAFAISGTNILINVTGVIATNINWNAVTTTISVA